MKRVLIVGETSYIGRSFSSWVQANCPDAYAIETISVKTDSWREKSLENVDVVLFLAAIVHRKETAGLASSYYRVNGELPVEFARAAKQAGVRQFIFMSTMAVYGKNEGIIRPDTAPDPRSLYAKSKYKAEQELLPMQDENFCVAIVRAPMAYGAGCPGNFQSLVRIAQRFPVFPAVKNRRSMIYIEHLAAFFDLLIQNTGHGIFFPQNREYVSTQEMVSILAQQMNKTIHFSRFLGLLVVLARPFVSKVKKAFGSLIYSDMEDFAFQYSSFELEQTLRRSVPDEAKN